jgi:uncharacterized membrane protein (DUF2068 family)
MQRPTGITILAVLAAIGGVLGLLASLALLGIGAVVATATGLGGFAVVAGLIVLVYSVLSLILAYGFWTLKPWAWPLGVAVEILGIVQALLNFANNTSNVASLIISLAIAAFILWYLFQPHVKTAFGRA